MLFDWLLEQINDWLSPSEMDSTVGILDIYGFEVGIQPVLRSGKKKKKENYLLDVLSQPICVPLQDLGVNSFEQLCINFANEQLQQFVNNAVITQEQVSELITFWVPL